MLKSTINNFDFIYKSISSVATELLGNGDWEINLTTSDLNFYGQPDIQNIELRIAAEIKYSGKTLMLEGYAVRSVYSSHLGFPEAGHNLGNHELILPDGTKYQNEDLIIMCPTLYSEGRCIQMELLTLLLSTPSNDMGAMTFKEEHLGMA
jgi:hypothetical protein